MLRGREPAAELSQGANVALFVRTGRLEVVAGGQAVQFVRTEVVTRSGQAAVVLLFEQLLLCRLELLLRQQSFLPQCGELPEFVGERLGGLLAGLGHGWTVSVRGG